ncbi:MAG: zinc-ribbon and FHA domain-containing protein [candidate division Zixibacteria bacterium]|nr:zinc-ribbon and FHA domain-containing protein [candidate division Zixibacteria bacterium]
MICPACGHENHTDTQFCTQCGADMDTQSSGRLIVISEPATSLLNSRRGIGSGGTEERRGGIRIAQTPFLIGRNRDNTLILNDDQTSANHARIVSDSRQIFIEDAGSTNGTFVDGVRIETPTSLKDGSLIKIGSTILKYEAPE